MAKRLDDLDNDPLPPRADLLQDQAAAQTFADEIRALEEDETYQFAWGTLVDIRLTVERTNRVTPGQRQAIDNIREGAERYQEGKDRGHSRGGSRRYEGFGGKGRRW